MIPFLLAAPLPGQYVGNPCERFLSSRDGSSAKGQGGAVGGSERGKAFHVRLEFRIVIA